MGAMGATVIADAAEAELGDWDGWYERRSDHLGPTKSEITQTADAREENSLIKDASDKASDVVFITPVSLFH